MVTAMAFVCIKHPNPGIFDAVSDVAKFNG